MKFKQKSEIRNQKFLLIILLGFFTAIASAQELRCQLTVNAQKVTGVDPVVFQTMQTALNEFMNNKVWTTDQFSAEERIECNLFIQIEEANKQMAISQHFTQHDLELDPRITQELIDCLKVQLALIRRKLEFEVERAKLGREKVMDYFIDPLEHLQFEVQGIRLNLCYQSVRISMY